MEVKEGDHVTVGPQEFKNLGIDWSQKGGEATVISVWKDGRGPIVQIRMRASGKCRLIRPSDIIRVHRAKSKVSTKRYRTERKHR